VDVGHDPVVRADARDALFLEGAGVERAELAHGVAIADAQLGELALVAHVLRHRADGAELVERVVAADGRAALDHAVRADLGAGGDAHVRADDGVRADA
jgi:hypothetical protein